MAMTAAACSGADGGAGGALNAADQRLADAITWMILEDSDPDSPFGKDEATCFGDRIVGEMGSDRLIELGLDAAAVEAGTTPADVDLNDGDVDAMVDAMATCVDFRALLLEEFETGGVSDKGVACISDGLADDFLEKMARASFADADGEFGDDPSTGDEMFNLVMACLSIDDLEKLSSG